jgi:transcriptional regulator with XRE-family HTH domain
MKYKVISNIGEKIKESGLRDDYIAMKVGGVTQKTVYNWRKGISYPTFKKTFILAEVLNCSTDDFAKVIAEEK